MSGRWLTGGVMALVLALCVLPAAAWGGDDEDESITGVFTVKASNGYRLLVWASAQDPGEPGEVAVFALHRSGERAAFYLAPAVVTATSLHADLGSVGRIDLQLFKTGRQRTVRTRCAGFGTFERANYWGTFEFRGEQGFTEASANRIPYNPTWFFKLLLCGKDVDMGAVDPGEPRLGVFLHARARLAKRSVLSLEAAKNRPEGRTLVRAALTERRGGIAIQRAVGMFAGASDLRYGAKLSTATLDPPTPFSGSAFFQRDGDPDGRWKGTLQVDFPGRANVSLTRADLRPTIGPGNWTVSDRAFERPLLERLKPR